MSTLHNLPALASEVCVTCPWRVSFTVLSSLSAPCPSLLSSPTAEKFRENGAVQGGRLASGVAAAAGAYQDTGSDDDSESEDDVSVDLGSDDSREEGERRGGGRDHHAAKEQSGYPTKEGSSCSSCYDSQARRTPSRSTVPP